ncbi:MAG: DNA internalization-related competence protein ComEC/Rec2 [Rhodocyclaceae bacterium]|nr:DNA internalization-related competence protein ComEC/Rec2 [Rhodocyclaceae bacterium]
MYAIVVAAVFACWLLQSRPVLPSVAVMLAIAGVGLALAALAWASRGRMWARAFAAAAAFGLAFAWSGLRAEWRLADELAAGLEGRDQVVSGAIVSLPRRTPGAVVFDFAPEQGIAGVPGLLRLRWYAPHDDPQALPHVSPGQRWRLTVRLRRPHARVNPHAADSGARLLQQGIRAVGYVRAREAQARLPGHGGGARAWIAALRQSVRERFETTLGGRPWAGVAVAVAVGDQSAIGPAQWQELRDLGIVHLAVVSGLHVSMAAACGGLLVAACWRLSRLGLRLPAPTAGVLAGGVMAWLYAALSGFGLPVQRSALMLTIVGLAWLAGRRMRPGRVLAVALLAVLAFDPWAVLAPGLWLSFVAVAILLIAGRRAAAQGGWRRLPGALLRTQLAINLAMAPILLIFFQQFSLVAPIANLLAVPVFSLLVLPLCLAYVVLPVDGLALLAEQLVTGTMTLLGGSLAGDGASWRQAAPPMVLVVPAALGCLWAVLPRGTPGRAAALTLLVPLLLFRPERPAAGDFELVALDVGQGLAVHVATAGHDLLFDTGPGWPGGDAGRSVIVPYLRASGVAQLDLLAISHADRDHSGGARSVAAALPVVRGATVAGVDTADFGGSWGSCRAGDGWTWDGVRFDWLNPLSALAADGADRNERSCVLRVNGVGGTALIAADIGRAAEARLLAADAAGLRADLVLVPHHGSTTSSSPPFVAAVSPSAAIFSVGHRSRFGHPRPEVWARWSAVGARGLRTDSQGAIRARFEAGGLSVSAERERRERYWHGR